MDKEKINRINFLARKAKTDGLTFEESEEQKRLRAEYISEYRNGLEQTLENTYIVDEKGNKKKLQRKPKNLH